MNITLSGNGIGEKKAEFEKMLAEWNNIFIHSNKEDSCFTKSYYETDMLSKACSIEDKQGFASRLFPDVSVLAETFWKKGGISPQMLKIPVHIECKTESGDDLVFTIIKLCYGNKVQIRLQSLSASEKTECETNVVAVTDNGINIDVKDIFSKLGKAAVYENLVKFAR